MYKHLTKEGLQKILGVPSDYRVDAFVVTGTHPKQKEYPHFFEALQKLGVDYEEEKITTPFFSEIKSLRIGQKRIWFDVAYGTAYLSEITHMASMFGSQANILLGTCGGLQGTLNTGDTVLPESSYGDESSTRMYGQENFEHVFASDAKLRSAIKDLISHRSVIHEGRVLSVQAMLAETQDDVRDWNAQGYVGVDMESATIFAVSNHFKVPCAALLYVADNLVKNELVMDPAYEALRAQRTAIRKENYEIALKVCLGQA